MTITEFANTVTDLPADKQNEFFKVLKSLLSEEDWLTTVKFVSLHGMFRNPEKLEAMKQAVYETYAKEVFQ